MGGSGYRMVITVNEWCIKVKSGSARCCHQRKIGNWMPGFYEHFWTCTSIRVELNAVLRGLHMAKAMGLKKVCST